jgi:membrane protease YdiL (CAAX protease family)
VAFGGCLIIALLMEAQGLNVNNAPWYVAGAMWLPALGRLLAVRSVDRGWATPLPLTRWGRPRWFPLGGPLLIVAAVYAVSYGIAALTGLAAWSPRWGEPARIVLNLGVNLILGLPLAALYALGEELGWRGYLQPRLESAGVPFAFLFVAVLWWAYHLPLVVLGGYLADSSPLFGQARFLLLEIALSLLFAWASYRAGSVWPAVWFHAAHNLLSQNIFPALFQGTEKSVWLQEAGILPVAAYCAIAAALLLSGRHRPSTLQDVKL